MTYDNTNSGTIGKNKRKEKDTHPDIAGSLNVEGKDFWINGWHKKNKETGEGFYSLSVRAKDGQQQAENQSQDPDDDIPFN